MTINVGFFGREQSRISLNFNFGKSEEEQVYIYLDDAGLDEFIKDLQALRSADASDHFHYFSEDWGTGELETGIIGDGFRPVHHLKVIKE